MTALHPLSALDHCPDPDTLAAFHQGRLPVDDLPAVAGHLAACPRCAAGADTPDDLLSALRDQGTCDFPADGPDLRSEMSKVTAIGLPDGTAVEPLGDVDRAVPTELREYRL